MKEIDKVIYFMYYLYNEENVTTLTIDDISKVLVDNGFNMPNKSRLRTYLNKSKKITKGSKQNTFRLHINTIHQLEKIVIYNDYENIEQFESIIPDSLYSGNREYINKIIKQINASFENNIYDGCAVLMRQLLEILLIQTFENYKIENIIKIDNNYMMLSKIIDAAKNNVQINLSRNTKECLEIFKELGNFSAHKIYYSAKRKDIERIILNYRATIEELLYKSNLK